MDQLDELRRIQSQAPWLYAEVQEQNSMSRPQLWDRDEERIRRDEIERREVERRRQEELYEQRQMRMMMEQVMRENVDLREKNSRDPHGRRRHPRKELSMGRRKSEDGRGRQVEE